MVDHSIAINPGTGPVEQASLEQAQANMPQFCEDCKAELPEDWGVGWSIAVPDKEMVKSGRFQFYVSAVSPDGRTFEHEVDMPGLPLDQVRYTGEDDQDIWDYPRLYVDGSSWVWMYAIRLHDDDEDDDE